MKEPAADSTDVQQVEGRDLDKSAIAKLVAAVALVGLFAIFAVQNAASIEVEFLAWSFSTRRIILMVASALIGIAVWELAGFIRRRNRSKQ